MASRIHVVRHGEVHNPDGVLYGRLPDFHLSERGTRTAALAAEELLRSVQTDGRPIVRVLSSPLERAQESAAPIAAALGLPIELREGLIEASSKLEGGQFSMSLSILAKPRAWRYLVNPFAPSWGEPFRDVAERMQRELNDAFDVPESGDVVMVSHQLPIWMSHRVATGKPLFHDPRKRRCALSSITSFERSGDRLIEIDYRDVVANAGEVTRDVGAV